MSLPFVGPSYTLAIGKADRQRSVNMHLVSMETPGKAPFILDSVPGLVAFAALGSEIRGSIEVFGRCFFAAGSSLYELSDIGAPTYRGSLGSSSGVVSMAYGLFQVVMVDGPKGYVLNLATNAFAEITSPGFYGSTRVRFLDNYFLFIRPGTQQFYITAINDATTLDALDFASAEGSPDNLVSIEVDHSELWLLGSVSTEVWFNSGAADFPFQRNRGASVEVGCMAAHSVAKIDNSVFWIGRDVNGSGIVYRAQGFQPIRISTQAIEQALQASSDLSKAVAYTYQDKGLTFYAINAPGLTATWVYEVSTGTWHERCDLDSNGQFIAGRATSHVFAFGLHLVGDASGNVYKYSKTTYLNGLAPLVRERVSPHAVLPGRYRQAFDAFYMDATSGEAGSSISTFVELSYSNDSGATWSNSILRSLGEIGERFARLTWRRLGRARDRIWKVRYSGNAPFSIIDVNIETTAGTN